MSSPPPPSMRAFLGSGELDRIFRTEASPDTLSSAPDPLPANLALPTSSPFSSPTDAAGDAAASSSLYAPTGHHHRQHHSAAAIRIPCNPSVSSARPVPARAITTAATLETVCTYSEGLADSETPTSDAYRSRNKSTSKSSVDCVVTPPSASSKTRHNSNSENDSRRNGSNTDDNEDDSDEFDQGTEDSETSDQQTQTRPSRRKSFARRLRKRAASLKSEWNTTFGRKDRRRASEPSSHRSSSADLTQVPSLTLTTTSTTASTDQIETPGSFSGPPQFLIVDKSRSSPPPVPLIPLHIVLYPHNPSYLAAAGTPTLSSTVTMASRQNSSAFLDPAAISRHQQLTAQKARTTKIARDEEAFIRARMRKKGLEHLFPKYQFVDFIGKGTYGRVFQAYDLSHDPPRDVAIKLMNLDDVDYRANGVEKDETLKDVKNEINILMQLKDARARNVNLIYDVLEADGHLWIVCEHCPGGSLRTLLRASNNRCDEKYIRVVARELAIGLAAIHGANVIHRDLKAANVMIHEQGGLQIIDFGVAGAVESKTDKRKTYIGTPYWMAPEQHVGKGGAQYGFEVDIWAYAITLYEIATGTPPNLHLPTSRLGQSLRRSPPRLNEANFPKELCDFFEFVAQVNVEDRPSVQDILDHPYILGSEQRYPTAILRDLVDKFLDWSLLGGQRTSLFMGSGAPAASDFADDKSDENNIDFIFSTSRNMLQEFDPDYDLPATTASTATTALPSLQISSPTMSGASSSLDYQSSHSESGSFLAAEASHPGTERRVARGGQALEALFDASQEPYEYNVRNNDMVLDRPIISRAKSDLPLRNADSAASDLAHKEVDFNDSSSSKSDVELADADTIKQKRKQQPKRDTMGWQPDWGNVEASMDLEPEVMPEIPVMLAPTRPPLIHAESAPVAVAQARASVATLNLDDMMGDDDWMAGSAMGSSSIASPNTMQGHPEVDEEVDADVTITQMMPGSRENSFDSYDSSLADISASEDESIPMTRAAYSNTLQPFSPITPLTSSHSLEPHTYPDMWAPVTPPNPTALRDDATVEQVEAEVKRMLGGFMGELGALMAEFPTEEDIDIDSELGDGDSEEEELDDGAAAALAERRENV